MGQRGPVFLSITRWIGTLGVAPWHARFRFPIVFHSHTSCDRSCICWTSLFLAQSPSLQGPLRPWLMTAEPSSSSARQATTSLEPWRCFGFGGGLINLISLHYLMNYLPLPYLAHVGILITAAGAVTTRVTPPCNTPPFATPLNPSADF